MSEAEGRPPTDEFTLIDSLLRPLATDAAARGLADDVAVLSADQGGWILTHDTLVEGVHFLPTDPLDTVAQKLLRVNLSDLAAKGAAPFGYLLSCAWPSSVTGEERALFAAGLAADQARWRFSLLGGDTVATLGPLTVGATFLGRPLAERTPARQGARPGDRLMVSGPIGDGWLGLKAATGGLAELDSADREALVRAYRTPLPRQDRAETVASLARASLDVSDGLIADARHLTGPEVGLDLDLDLMPLSPPARAWLSGQADPMAARLALATGGDDYQVLMAVDPVEAEVLTPDWTAIGRFRAGPGLSVRIEGQVVQPGHEGWRH